MPQLPNDHGEQIQIESSLFNMQYELLEVIPTDSVPEALTRISIPDLVQTRT